MGSTKTQESSQTAQSTAPTPTAEETELNRLELERQRAAQPGMIATQTQGLNLAQLLLQGQQLPGYLGALPQGATAGQLPFQPDIPTSAGTLGEDYTSSIVQQSLRDLYPQFQSMGVPIESGVAQSIAGRTAGDIRRNVAESNIERQLGIEEYNRAQRSATGEYNLNTQMTSQYQNLNNLLNLLNLAVGGQAQIQQPVISTGAALGQRLAGLRSVSSTGTGTMSSRTTQPWYTAIEPIMTGVGRGIGAVGAGMAAF